MNNEENEIIGWDGSFMAEESNFTLLPAGDYQFTVTGFERKIYDGNSSKIQNGTPFAEITMEFTGPEGTTIVNDRLYMTKKWQWKLTQFFTGIGQAPVLGQPFAPNWGAVIGSQGIAKLKVNKFTKRDGSPGENNQVDEYLKPTNNPMNQQPAGAPQQNFNQSPQQNFNQQPAQQGFNQPNQQQQNTGFTPGAF